MQGNTQSIELDCPPGCPRPADLINRVIADTGLELPSEPPTTFFGSCEWTFQMPEAEWKERVVPIVRPRIEALYHAGTIRYGSW